MRGYFGIGVEGLSKPMNLGALFRSAQAFGASFVFTVAAAYDRAKSDTPDATGNLPYYDFADLDALRLPRGCALVGVEFRDDARDLPSFRHPRCAAYLLGPERGSIGAAAARRCDHVVKIPTRLCVNLSVAGAIVMYDRLLSIGRFAARPILAGQEPEKLAAHEFGQPVLKSRKPAR